MAQHARADPGPYSISDNETGGDCYLIGVWDGATKTCTLTTDVSDQINLIGNGITLDGNGKTVSTSGQYGIYSNGAGRTGLVVKNLVVSGPSYGIYLWPSASTTLSGNSISATDVGIYLGAAPGSTVSGNSVLVSGMDSEYGIYLRATSTGSTVSGNTVLISGGMEPYDEIYLSTSTGSKVIGNTAPHIVVYRSGGTLVSGNTAQIYIALDESSGSTVSGNTVSNIGLLTSPSCVVSGNTISMLAASYGLGLFGSGGSTVSGNKITVSDSNIGIQIGMSGNVVSGNTISGGNVGIYMNGLMSSTVTGNTVSGAHTGIVLASSNNNQIFNNNFINNPTQAYIVSGTGNIFNLDKPVGGNYWSDWTAPDIDGDGFVDNPYVFHGGQDNLPWTKKNGWLDNTPPETTLTIGEPNWLSIDTTFTYVTSATSFTLTATDDNSGVYGTYYRIDGGDWIDYAGTPFTLGSWSLGAHTVDYYSVDKMGNVEAFKSATVSLISPIAAKAWADNVPIYDKAGNLLATIDHTSLFRITGSLEGIVLLQVHNQGPKSLTIMKLEVRGVSPPLAGTGTATLLSVPPQIAMDENKSFLADVSVTGLWHGNAMLRLWLYFTIEGVQYHVETNVQFRA